LSAPSAPLAKPAPIDARVAAEEVRTLYQQGPPVLVANVVNSSIVAAVLWNTLPHVLLASWVAAMVVMSATRLVLRRKYWSNPPAIEAHASWGRAFVIGSLAAGVLWGFAGGVFFVRESLTAQLLIAFVIGGMGAGAAGTLSCYMPAFYAYFVPSLVPLIVRLLTMGSGVHQAMAGMTALYAVLFIVIARNIHRSVHEAFRLRFELAEAQQHLSEANADLERRVAERTIELQVRADALRESEQKLRDARRLEAIGRLAGGIAHDFNNLLTVSLSNLSMALAEKGLTDHSREAIEEARQASQRAAELTQQLLAFGRRQVLEPRAVDLNVVITKLKKMLERLMQENIELRFELDARGAPVKVDPTQLEQVVVNLVINARDAMPEGGVLTLRTTHDDDASTIVLTVIDTGIGMDEETRARVFEPFFSATGGTGLGLATVHGIVEQSGGTIVLESTLGKGSRFDVRLPRTDEAPVSKPVTKPPPSRSIPSGSETILVVEDEDLVRRATTRVLRKAGYEVLTAVDGEDAIAIAEKHEGRIDLLLSDVVMPKMSGPELAERMLAMRPDLRVLLVSGYAGDVVLKARPADARVRFLPKPFNDRTLAEHVRAHLDA